MWNEPAAGTELHPHNRKARRPHGASMRDTGELGERTLLLFWILLRTSMHLHAEGSAVPLRAAEPRRHSLMHYPAAGALTH